MVKTEMVDAIRLKRWLVCYNRIISYRMYMLPQALVEV